MGAQDCEATVLAASDSEYHLANSRKQANYIYGTVENGVLDFVVYNLPADGTGCPGRWLFQVMLAHFQSMATTVNAIGGNWSGKSTNLLKVNALTANNALSLEDAAKLTNTGLYATQDAGYVRVHVLYPDPSDPKSVGTVGAPGQYTRVNVRFTR